MSSPQTNAPTTEVIMAKILHFGVTLCNKHGQVRTVRQVRGATVYFVNGSPVRLYERSTGHSETGTLVLRPYPPQRVYTDHYATWTIRKDDGTLFRTEGVLLPR